MQSIILPFTRKCTFLNLIVGIVAFASETHSHDAALSCKLRHRKDVVLVTWKKITSSSTQNVATYSERFGATIMDPFQVKFLKAGLHDSVLQIRGVGRESEACYMCIFSTFPKGTVQSTVCLKAHELNKPVTEHREVKTRDGHIIHRLSCSERHVWDIPRHKKNDDPVEHAVGHFDSSSESTVSVIKATVLDNQVLTCVVHPSPVEKVKNMSMLKGEPRVFLSNENGGLSLKPSLVIFGLGLSVCNVMSDLWTM
ncbi:hypothetical protein GJAV_G00253620 [Gymnothorax javanicus]|nr:hypothetical protein GJAV_G00253620 [Gymnothorax javanicus]